MTFLTAIPGLWLLMGALGALVPLLIHLSRSRRTKKMQFSTTRFFTDEFLRSYRMNRIRELLLLLCRMALGAFLALAMAQPLFSSRNSVRASTGSRAVVLVIDNSASMGRIEEVQSLFERVRLTAKEILAGCKPGDQATIVLAGRRDVGPEEVFPQLNSDLDEVKQALDQIAVSSLGTDLSGSVSRAVALLRGNSASSKEVYVLSDLQDTGWDDRLEEPPPGSNEVSVAFVRIQGKNTEQLAITAVQYGSSRPMIGVPFEIKPYVLIQGERASCEVRLVIDGDEVARRTIEKSSRSIWATPRFFHTFSKGGWHSGFIEVLGSSNPEQSKRFFAFQLLDSVKVLAINGSPSTVPHLDELAYLRAALTATPDESQESPIRVDALSVAEFSGKSLNEIKPYPLVILANVESLAPSSVEKLEEYVENGGKLLVFLGDQVRGAAYNESLASPTRKNGGLLPVRLLQREGDPAGSDAFASVSEVDFEHPALTAFADPRFGNLMGVRFKAIWKCDPSTNANVLMKASTGSPLLLEKEFGRGRVMLFTSTCDRDWTNFPVRPTYLPWTHRLVGYLVQDSAGSRIGSLAGEEILVPDLPGTGPVSVKKPDGREGYPVAQTPESPRLLFGETQQAGIYSFSRSAQQEKSIPIAVNVPSEEANLVALDETIAERFPELANIENREEQILEGLRKLMPSHPKELIYFINDPSKINEAVGRSGGRLPLWDILLLLILLLALVEPWLANRIIMKHYGKAKSITSRPLDQSGTSRSREEVKV